MVNFQTRLLEKNDLPEINLLVLKNKKTVQNKFRVDVQEYHLKQISPYLDEEHPSFLVGTFSKSKSLTSIVGIWPWVGFPYATINFLQIDPIFRGFFSPKDSGFIDCIDLAYRLGEEREIYSYYFFRKKGVMENSISIWKKYATDQIKKYVSFVECYIPENTKPEKSVYWEIMEERLWPFEIEIRKVIKRPESFPAYLDYS